MRLAIAIAALPLVLCIGATSAAFAAKGACSGGPLELRFSVPHNASPAARCLAIKRQCGGKFYADYCGDKMLADM